MGAEQPDGLTTVRAAARDRVAGVGHDRGDRRRRYVEEVIVALRCLGYDDDSPQVTDCHKQLNDLSIEDPVSGAVRLQPCKSPVWDTAITLRALSSGGVRSDNGAVQAAVEWLLEQQIDEPGDWSETVKAEPGGWCFEHNNDFYPDSDDTAMVLMALAGQFSDTADPTGGLPPELVEELQKLGYLGDG